MLTETFYKKLSFDVALRKSIMVVFPHRVKILFKTL